MKKYHCLPIFAFICIILFIIFGVICLLLVAAPDLLFSDNTEYYIQMGMSNAGDYVENKYGFHAGVNKTTVERDSNGELLPFVLVTMRYNDSTFTVVTDGTKLSSEGKDNYQQDIIAAAFLSSINSIVGAEPVGYHLAYVPSSIRKYKHDTQLVSTYFDGTNLKEVFTENSMTATLEYVGDVSFEQLLSYDITNTFFETGSMIFISYPTEEAMNQVGTHLYDVSNFKGYIYHNAIYIQNAVYISANEPPQNAFDIIEYDGFYLPKPEKLWLSQDEVKRGSH